MANIQSLPNELLDQIFSDLPKSDLVSLSKTCKQIAPSVSIPLYSTVRFDSSSDTNFSLFASFLQTVVTRPDLANLVKKLKLRIEWRSNSNEGETLIPILIQQLLERCSNLSDLEWIAPTITGYAVRLNHNRNTSICYASRTLRRLILHVEDCSHLDLPASMDLKKHTNLATIQIHWSYLQSAAIATETASPSLLDIMPSSLESVYIEGYDTNLFALAHDDYDYNYSDWYPYPSALLHSLQQPHNTSLPNLKNITLETTRGAESNYDVAFGLYRLPEARRDLVKEMAKEIEFKLLWVVDENGFERIRKFGGKGTVSDGVGICEIERVPPRAKEYMEAIM